MGKQNKKIRSKFHGDKLYAPLVQSFVEDLPKEYGELESQTNNQNFKKAIEHCHRLGGSAATYGYPGLAVILERFEKKLIENPMDEKTILNDLYEVKAMIENISSAL